MQRKTLIRTFLVLGASLAAGLWAFGPGAGGDVPDPGRPAVPSARERAARRLEPGLPPTSSRIPATVPAQSAASTLARAPRLDDAELRLQLRRVASVALQDQEALERALAPLLSNPANLERVLFLLRGQGLATSGSALSQEEVGAIRAIACAAIVYNPPEGTPDELAGAGIEVDGRAFVGSVLAALADVAPPARGILAEMLGTERDRDGRLILGLEYAGELERLAALDPELSELYLGLLAEVSTDLDADAARALDLQFLDGESPKLVNASLTRLLSRGDSPAALDWAAALLERSDTGPELRRAITAAVAAAAPVDDAASFLAERAKPELLMEFDTLGARGGGLEALEEEYYTLRVFDDADDEARRMLVSGMARAGTDGLLAIALDDPSAAVRGQAWTTLTVAADYTPSARALDLLREGFQDRADAEAGIPAYAAITAAANFALRARSQPELLAQARAFLVEIAEDPGVSDHDRRKAIEKLERFASPTEISRLLGQLDG